MTQWIIRFILGGVVVSTVPVLAQYAGPSTAGVFLLFPATSLAGLYFLGQTQGAGAMATAAAAAAWALPTVLAFLLGVHWSARAGLPVVPSLAVGACVWLIVALPVGWLVRGGSSGETED